MRIKTLYYLGACIGVATILAIGATLITSAHRVKQAADRSNFATEILVENAELRSVMFEFLLHPNAPSRLQWQQRHVRLTKLLDGATFDGTDEEQVLIELRRHHRDVAESFARLSDSYASAHNGPADAVLSLELETNLTDRLVGLTQAIVTDTLRLQHASDVVVVATESLAHTQIMLSVAVMGVLLVANVVLIFCYVLIPIDRLRRGMEIIGKGDLSYRTRITGRNEIGALSQAIDHMTGQVQASHTALEQRAAQLIDANRELESFKAELERRVTERTLQLERADRAKSEFMSNITHELRTPLNSVIGFAELLKDEVPGALNARQAGFVADILASGQDLLTLVEGILEMSRLELDAAAMQREPVEIGGVIRERVAACGMAAVACGVTLRVDVAPETGSAALNAVALCRVLDALIDNAVKFNRDGGTVVVSARRVGGALEIAVTDTGIGIAREDLGKLFMPLVQLDAGLARRRGGVGMGLALARRLSELHGGTIDVESEPGKGSTFTLRLPLEEKKQ